MRRQQPVRNPLCPCSPSLLLLGMALGLADSVRAQAIPIGPEFRINTFTTSDQSAPAIAQDGTGGFVVLWQSFGSPGADTDGNAILARRYDSAGQPLGTEFGVNSYTPGNQAFPAITQAENGGFVAAWHSQGSGGTDSSDFSVQARRFDLGGNPIGTDFQVNTLTAGNQSSAAVRTVATGGFVIAWTGEGSGGTDNSSFSIQARRYDATGSPIGTEFQVNTYITSQQFEASLHADGSGGFVVAWSSFGSASTDPSSFSIQARRYDAAGSPIGTEFQVNTYTTGDQRVPAIGPDGAGGFVIAWGSDGSAGTDSESFSIQAQRFDVAGQRLGAQFQVNTSTTAVQMEPVVSENGTGGFVVAWHSSVSAGTDNFYSSIQRQSFSSTGAALGGELQVNTATTSAELSPALTADEAGGLVIAWQGLDPDSVALVYDIRAQRFGAAAATQTPTRTATGLATATRTRTATASTSVTPGLSPTATPTTGSVSLPASSSTGGLAIGMCLFGLGATAARLRQGRQR